MGEGQDRLGSGLVRPLDPRTTGRKTDLSWPNWRCHVLIRTQGVPRTRRVGCSRLLQGRQPGAGRLSLLSRLCACLSVCLSASVVSLILSVSDSDCVCLSASVSIFVCLCVTACLSVCLSSLPSPPPSLLPQTFSAPLVCTPQSALGWTSLARFPLQTRPAVITARAAVPPCWLLDPRCLDRLTLK